MRMRRNKRVGLFVLAALYACAMAYLLLWRRPAESALPYAQQLRLHLNLQPLHTIRRYVRVLVHSNSAALLRLAFRNLFGNVLLFLPLGFFPPLIWPRMQRFWKTALLAAGIMVVIEAAQMLLLVGTCDVDDVLLNVLGASIGYGLYRLLNPPH